MKILLLATDIYGGHGGIALFNRELVTALLAHPDCEEVTVIPRIVPHPDRHLIPDRVRFVASAARTPVLYTKAILAAKRARFDLVICGHVNLLPVARFITPHPLLITHGIEAWRPLRNPLSNRLLQQCRGIVSVSALTRDRLRSWSHYAGPMYVLPNAVHLEEYSMRPKRQDLIDRYDLRDKRVLLTVGRIVARERYKGFREVIEVLGRLPEDVVYVIAGGGDDIARLQQSARELGVADRVRFTGLFPENEKTDLYNLADVYVMPSRGEGFGFVFIEALACGVPVIGSKADGGREALLDGQLGLLVDPANPYEIEAAIRDALNFGKREIPAGLEFFSFEKFVERVGGIVDAAAPRPGSRAHRLTGSQ
ncbi:MAG TPA: glycosyltransferase family 4 protein [Thermoanaerobaculia bacterium]|nr:glycosyltransferase family 4 protein [Thermoanaerobaculia bacterium]